MCQIMCVCVLVFTREAYIHPSYHPSSLHTVSHGHECMCAQTEAYACQELKGHARPGALSQLVRASWELFDDQVHEGRHSQFNVPLASSRRGLSCAKKRHPKSGESLAMGTLEANRLATAHVPS